MPKLLGTMSLFGRAGTRIASVGLGSVLVFLAVFAIVTARQTNGSAQRVQRSSLLSEAYAQAAKAVVSQGYWVTEYMLKLGPGAKYLDAPEFRVQHRQAAGALVGALVIVTVNGTSHDRALAVRLLALNRAYTQAAHRLFAAVDSRDGEGAVGIQLRYVDPAYLQIKRLVQTASTARQRQAVSAVLSLSHAHELVLAGTLLFFTLGLVLVAAFGVMLRVHRRRAELESQAELARFEEAALTDHLTGLGNHRAFHETLERELRRRARSRAPLSLVMLDLDGLKKANDMLGHQAGDRLIQALAECMERAVRGGDALYRIGGDEFAVILAGESAEAAERVLRRVRSEFAASSPTGLRSVTGSVAEASHSIDIDRDSLIRTADLALLEAKRARPQLLARQARPDAPPAPRVAFEPGT